MAQDLATEFGRGYLPSYLKNMSAQQLRSALQTMATGGPSLAASNQNSYYGRKLENDVYLPWEQNTGQKMDIGQWAQQYWDWLSRSAPTRQLVPGTPSTQVSTQEGNIADNVLHYVPGTGYVSETDLQNVDPDQYAAIQAQRQAATADTGNVNPYYESNIVKSGTPGTPASMRNVLNSQFAPNIVGQAPLTIQQPYVVPGPYYPGKGTAGGAGVSAQTAPAAASAPAAGSGGTTDTVATGNRNGNYATTSTPGAVVVTPTAVPDAASDQMVQTIGKRVGRNLAQNGVTKIPNLREQYSRSVRQSFRRF
jgi:hypothetical protein